MSSAPNTFDFGPRYSSAAHVVAEHLTDRGEVQVWTRSGRWALAAMTDPRGLGLDLQTLIVSHDGLVHVYDANDVRLAEYELRPLECQELVEQLFELAAKYRDDEPCDEFEDYADETPGGWDE